MAGTLTIATLSDGVNSTSSTNCIQGSAKAWVNYGWNGSSMVNYASYNVSSVTRSGAGTYTVNFTNAFSDINYSWNTGVSSDSSSATYMFMDGTHSGGAKTTSAIRFQVFAGANADRSEVCFSAFR